MIARERLIAAPWSARRERDAPVPAARGGSALALVCSVLPAVALTELLLIRTFYRVGIYIPKEGPFALVYRVLTAAGSFALNLSSVLALVALALLAARAWRAERLGAALALGAVAAIGVIVALAGVRELGPVARLAFVLAVLTVARPALAKGDPVHRLAVLTVAAVMLVSQTAGFAADAGFLAPGVPRPLGPVGPQLAAEAFAVLAAFLLLASAVRSGRLEVRAVLIGLVPALALLAAWRANGAVTGILVIWTAGLRLYLPMWVYAVALWAFTAAGAAWYPDRRGRAGALALLLAAGVTLGTTYQQALALVGLALLTDAASFPSEPSGGPASAAAGRRAEVEVARPPADALTRPLGSADACGSSRSRRPGFPARAWAAVRWRRRSRTAAPPPPVRWREPAARDR
ncbi:MAG: hypothetical protein KatS3mg014_0686 [Actinomycetota bacterium]|nr:MAG: hypothetical protein KatS3mg014_0686 [Actinomycetota bacterium]